MKSHEKNKIQNLKLEINKYKIIYLDGYIKIPF